jgi:hypothetical protein
VKFRGEYITRDTLLKKERKKEVDMMGKLTKTEKRYKGGKK